MRRAALAPPAHCARPVETTTPRLVRFTEIGIETQSRSKENRLFSNQPRADIWPRSGPLGADSMDDGILRTIDNTIGFLRMTAVELRRIAERSPEVAEELRRIADKLEADANDLSGRIAGRRRI